MARFLSAAWFEALRVAAAGVEVAPAGAGARITLQQRVVGGADGDVVYAISVDDGVLDVRPGPADDPDATFTEDYDTAVAISRGDLSPQQALMAGRIRVSGNLGALIDNQPALAAIAPVLASVADTTY